MRRQRVLTHAALATVAAACLTPLALGLPVITDVVETGGDNEATDTITARFTGQTWNTTVADEPTLNTPVGTPFTVPVFGEEVPCFVDRAHQWNGATLELPIPEYLLGAEYIMCGNDNRDNAAYQLDITVSDAAVVYLLIDNRYPNGKDNATPPNYDEGVDPANWTTSLAWIGEQGFKPVINGINRASSLEYPDEIGVDEGGNGTGPGGDIQQFSSIYSKTIPAPGTFSVFQPDNSGRNMYGVAVRRLPNSVNNPPEIRNLTPANNTLFHPAAGGLSFTVTTVSPNSIAAGGLKLSLNGTDVSAGLNVGGTGTSRTASYSQLQADTLYTGRIVASDQAGRSTTNSFIFDTFSAATAIAIEAEDYNYDSGKFVNPPVIGGYANLAGTKGVDFQNNHGTTAAANYRTTDQQGIAAAGDVARSEFANGGLTDYAITQIEAGDWLNVTRGVADKTYAVYLRASSAVEQPVRFDRVIGAATTSQTIEALGTFFVRPVAGAPYAYAPLADSSGTPILVRLSGTPTLRLTAVAASVNLQLNYLLLVPAAGDASPAYVSSASPTPGAVNVAPDSVVEVGIANGKTTAVQNTIALTFNGTAVTSAATVIPTAEGFVVTYDPPGLLAGGAVQTAAVSFKDDTGASISGQWAFTTAASLPAIPANYATPVGSGQNPGLKLKMRKAPNLNAALVAYTLANTSARADDQLADLLIDPDTLAPYINEAAGPAGTGLADGSVVNFEQTGTGTGYFSGDQPFPYVDLNYDPDPNNLAMEATMFLEFPAGVHRLGVRSDDGFRVTTGPNLAEATMPLGVFEGGRGNGLPGGTTEFDFVVETAGVYPLRLVWYEGNGGANVEFYSVDRNAAAKILVNDPANPKALKAFRSRSSDIQVPTVAITSPADGAKFPNGPVTINLAATASVNGSQIAKVEFFESGVKLGEDATAPYNFAWNGVLSGRYALTAVATDARGLTKTSSPVRITVGTPILINFQASSSEGFPDYLPDYGDVFDDRGNGYRYGWDLDNTANSRDRNDTRSPDERYDTFNHLQKPQPAGSFWEIEIPNGRYKVYAVAGEPANFDGIYDLTAEGITIVKGTPTDIVRFYEGQGAVTVQDGRLTIGNGPTAANNKVCFVEIYTLPAEVPQPVFGPTVLHNGNVTVTWTNGGTLQEATAVNGLWSNVSGNPSGTYTTPATGPQKFYRVFVP